MAIALDHTAFDTGVRDVREARVALTQTRDAATGRVEGFLRGGWSGLAAESYAEAWGDWRAAADDVLAGLAALADLLDATHADLAARDHDSRSALELVSARLHERLG